MGLIHKCVHQPESFYAVCESIKEAVDTVLFIKDVIVGK